MNRSKQPSLLPCFGHELATFVIFMVQCPAQPRACGYISGSYPCHPGAVIVPVADTEKGNRAMAKHFFCRSPKEYTGQIPTAFGPHSE